LGLPEVHLDGLDDASSRELLSLAAPALPHGLEARILNEAAGNPLALIELPAAAAVDGAAGDVLALPTRLGQAFARDWLARGNGGESRESRILSVPQASRRDRCR
jgi:hypothetical protein